MSDGVTVREAAEGDVHAIRDIFRETYGTGYPHKAFLDTGWLKRAVFNDDVLMLVAVDEVTDQVLGTASVVFDVGAHFDLLAELGRLAVHPDARGRGVGNALMDGRLRAIQPRVHMAIVENRTAHPWSQRISVRSGFAAVGFLPVRHQLGRRESVALFARHFGPGLSLRKNHPRIIPEAHALAHVALANCGLPADVIVDDEAVGYPADDECAIESLRAEGMSALLRIERGRVRRREVFGAMRLSHGFFKLEARRATYLLAREDGASDSEAPVGGAIGFIADDVDRAARVFEIIAGTDGVIRPLLRALCERCDQVGIQYVGVDVSAHATRMQRTLLELGFLPVAYVPAMVFHDVERLDVIKMARVTAELDMSTVELAAESEAIARAVMRGFRRQAVLPRIAMAMGELKIVDGLNDEQARAVARACAVRIVEEGAVLFAPEDGADEMFVILSGGVEVSRDGEVIVRMGPGDAVGEVALLTGLTHSATVTALQTTDLAVLTRTALDELTRMRPDISVVLYRNLAAGLGRKLRKRAAGR